MFTDVTERKQTEEALRLSEERFSKAFNSCPSPMSISVFPNGRYIEVNEAFLQVFGYRREEVIGFTRSDLNTWVVPEESARAIQILYEKKSFRNMESSLRTKSGEVRVGLISADIIEISGSDYTLAVFEDITDRKRADEKIREQLRFLQALIDAVPVPIFYKDLESFYRGCNNAFASMYGMNKEDMIGKSIFDISPEEQSNGSREMDLALFKNPGVQVYDCQVHFADGRDHDVIFHKSTYNDLSGLLTGLVGVVIDVTWLKQAEEKLRQRAAELQAVFQVLPDLFFRLGSDGTALELLAGCHDDLYLPVEELLGRRVQDALKELSHQFQQAIDQVIQTQSLVVIEYPLVIKGDTKYFEARFFPLLEDQIIEVVRNITYRKHIEEELQQHRQHLEELVAERTTELLAVNQELEAFTHSVAHDLRAPLRIIQGFSQILLEDYADRLDEQGSKHLERLKASSQQMSQLIQDLLDLSRVTSTALDREQTDLSALARAIAAGLIREQPERQAHFDIQEGITVYGDPDLLNIMLQNLMDNAWKFAGKKAAAEISFGITIHEGRQAYFVRDNGAGFNMAHAKKLFEPFKRLHSSKEFPGTGIGLASVRRIVRRHGGEIWAEGEVGRGATFYFTLKSERDA
jgi:PAS domain S-box-containing protein